MPKFPVPFLRGWLAVFLLTGSLSAQEEGPLQRARLFIAEANFRAAIPLLEELTAHDSLSVQGYYYLGLCYLSTGSTQEAVGTFRQAVDLDSTNVASLTALGRSYEQLGLMRQAEQAYLAAMGYDSSGSSVTPTVARFYADTKNWNKAIPLYESLAGRDSSHAGYQIQLAKCYTGLQAIESAIVHYERALQLSPLNAAAALELSALYLNTERLLSASRVIERILPQLRDHPQLWRRAGDIAFRQHSYNRAVVAYATSLFYGDSTASSFRNMGICYHFQENDSLALSLLDESVLRDSLDANNWFYRGVVNRNLGKYAESVEDFQRARELMLHGLLSDTYIQLGVTHEQMNLFPDALTFYREALFTDPTKAIIWYHLATLYDQHLNDMAKAEENYTEYLRQTEGQQSEYRTFAEKRLRAFREKKHFERK